MCKVSYSIHHFSQLQSLQLFMTIISWRKFVQVVAVMENFKFLNTKENKVILYYNGKYKGQTVIVGYDK